MASCTSWLKRIEHVTGEMTLHMLAVTSKGWLTLRGVKGVLVATRAKSICATEQLA